LLLCFSRKRPAHATRHDIPTAGVRLHAAYAASLQITTEHSPPSSMLGPDVVTGRATDKIRK
jgi:hypothetical protein